MNDVDIDDVLRDIARAVIESRRVQVILMRLDMAPGHERRELMSQLSNDIDALNATVVNLDNQAPGAITAAIAAAAASGGGTPVEDPAARASLTTLQATVAKTIVDLQTAVGTTATPL